MFNLVIDNIKSRRSVRSFQKKPIPEDIIERIVEAGQFAPSALNRQPWRFVVVRDTGTIKEFSSVATAQIKKLYKLLPIIRHLKPSLKDERVVGALKKTAEKEGDTIFYEAPLVIIVANDTRIEGSKQDCIFAAQNVMLAAHSMGVGSCFIGRGKAITKQLLLEKTGLPPCYDFNVFIALGYSSEGKRTPPPRKGDPVTNI